MIDRLPLCAALHIATHEWLAIAAFGIALSSLDDIVVDLIFGGRWLWREAFVYSRHAHLDADTLGAADPGWMAIIVPAWDEAGVIAPMLRSLLRRLDYPRYRVFVGVYPNDAATIAEVQAIGDNRVAAVMCTRPGPTTKADCLNHLWRAVLADEGASGQRFKAVVLHDAEDVVHPRELAVYDHLMPRLAMVQLPVVPIIDAGSRWVAGHYLDEFAEHHTKDIVVREAIGAAVPSAGVACAIERDMLGRIAEQAGGAPFDARCLTEDYELGLRIKALGGQGALVRIRGGPDAVIVATHEHFPATLDAALRQKTRWLLGIALAGWDRLGWQGGVADRYMLLRDRKAIVSALLSLAGYCAVMLVIADIAVRRWLPEAARFAPVAPRGSLLALLLWINAGVLLWRLALRAAFTAHAHGWREGTRAVPRALVANCINALAAWRAVGRYRRIVRGRDKLVWDKTSHRFPAGT